MATINRSDREIRQQPVGTIAEVHGLVVLIDCSRLPPLRQALFAVFDHTRYLFEVHQHTLTAMESEAKAVSPR